MKNKEATAISIAAAGARGAGKSTVLNLIADVLERNGATITWAPSAHDGEKSTEALSASLPPNFAAAAQRWREGLKGKRTGRGAK